MNPSFRIEALFYQEHTPQIIFTNDKRNLMNFAWHSPKMEKKGQITRSSLNLDNCVFLEKKEGNTCQFVIFPFLIKRATGTGKLKPCLLFSRLINIYIHIKTQLFYLPSKLSDFYGIGCYTQSILACVLESKVTRRQYQLLHRFIAPYLFCCTQPHAGPQPAAFTNSLCHVQQELNHLLWSRTRAGKREVTLL